MYILHGLTVAGLEEHALPLIGSPAGVAGGAERDTVAFVLLECTLVRMRTHAMLIVLGQGVSPCDPAVVILNSINLSID